MAKVDPALLDFSRYPFHHVVTTRYADVDSNQHINNVALAAAFEDARFRFDVAQGFAATMIDLRMVIAANYIDYIDEAHYPEPLDLYVGTLDIGRTSWQLACLALQNGRPCAFSRATMVSTSNGKPAPLPDQCRILLDGARLAVR